MNPSNQQLRMMVYASLLAALTATGSFIVISLGPVPIVLSNFFIMLTGLLLGSRWGIASVGVYLLAGACGLPVFSGGRGGIGHFMGFTGGYLIGYLPAVYIIGFISEKMGRRAVYDVVAMICGEIIIYGFGITWLIILFGKTFGGALAVGVVPFLIGDALKIATAVPIAKALRPVIHN